MSEELKPCPFCGKTQAKDGKFGVGVAATQGMNERGEYVEEGRQWSVICSGCGSSCSLYCDTEAEAIAAWNRRAAPTTEGEGGGEPTCPFCGHDPFLYVDNGVGMEAVAVTCCDLGDMFFRGARPGPETIEMSWEEFRDIGHRLLSSPVDARREALEEAAKVADEMAVNRARVSGVAEHACKSIAALIRALKEAKP